MTTAETLSVEIRPFAPVHQAGVVALVVGIQQDEFGFSITYEQQPDLQNIPGFFRKGAGDFWVALVGERVVGTIALVDLGNGQGAVRKMFVDSAYRGRHAGVAQRLLTTLLDWARHHGIADVCLGTTDKFRAAHRFYEKNGFIQVASESLPQSFPRMNVDTRFYRLLLETPSSEVTAT
jgi:N-acetylglutamate synthase-like GNAT family acetyltransferase